MTNTTDLDTIRHVLDTEPPSTWDHPVSHDTLVWMLDRITELEDELDQSRCDNDECLACEPIRQAYDRWLNRSS